MPLLLPKSPLSPQCIACCRNLSLLGLSISPAAGQVGQMQVRGKKKNPKARAQVNVKLIKDLPGYGRKGAIVPVPIGRMRNHYFPYHIANYVSLAEVRDLKRNKVTIERDYLFGKDASDEGAELQDTTTTLLSQPARATRSPDAVRSMVLLEPAAAFAALSATLPRFVDFYRTPIIAATESAGTSSPTEPSTTSTTIYGSVSGTDVATNLKALLASTEVAGRVVLGEEDVRFVGIGEEQSARLKQLGTFDIEIKIKGHGEAIRRQVRVLPEEDTPTAEAIEGASTAALPVEESTTGGASEASASMEAQVAELEAVLEDAKRSKGVPGAGEPTNFGQERVSENASSTANEKSV